MVHGEKRIPYWIDRRLTGLAGPDYDATISFGLPFELGDCPYGKYRLKGSTLAQLANFWPFIASEMKAQHFDTVFLPQCKPFSVHMQNTPEISHIRPARV